MGYESDQKRVLEELHQGHLGIVKMKSLARSYIWWPGIDKDAEEEVQSCEGCQQVQKAPALAPLHPWEWSVTPWERIHIDFAGPYLNYMYLVVVYAHSKWPEIFQMKNTTSSDTISILGTLFALDGVPMQLIMDLILCQRNLQLSCKLVAFSTSNQHLIIQRRMD